MDCQYASSAVSFGAASSGRIMADRVGEGGFGMRLCCTMKALTITYRLRRIWGTGEAITSLRFGGGGYPQPAITPSAGQIGRAHVELQSLMRISYAVFCLKKKKKQQ